MEISLLRDVISELEIIRWLLVALFVATLLILVMYFQLTHTVMHLISEDSVESRRFHQEAQDLYDRSRYKELRGVCERRIKTHKNDKWALYYLGIALLRLEKYADAKAHFTRVRELDPQWGEAVIEYLDEIDEHLSKNKPKPV